MKLSVVIPVYRVEATLDRCVESVLSQRIDGMEVILVDDGSPDRCPDMCDRWAARDQRVRVVHKPNGGLSDARNAGIDIAQGEYITFVDSDDWLAADTFGPLLDSIGDADMLEYSLAGGMPLKDRTYYTADEYWTDSYAYQHCYAWNKIYRRQLFDSARYPVGRVFEDVYTLPQLLRQCRQIATTSHGDYHYEWNPAGITANADGEALSQLLDAHLSSGMPMDDRYYVFVANIQIDVWERTGRPVLLPRRHLRPDLLEGRERTKATMLNIFGINTLCRISKIIHLFKKPSR